MTPDSVEEICTSAFGLCEKLVVFQVGAGLKKYGAEVFEGCRELIELRYSMNQTSYSEIENYTDTTKLTILFDETNLARAVEIPIYTPTKEISNVTLDGVSIPYTTVVEDGYVRAAVIETDNKYTLEGHAIEIEGKISDDKPQESLTSPDILSTVSGISAEEMI